MKKLNETVVIDSVFGFRWATQKSFIEVTRACEIDGHLTLMVKTGKELLQIRMTPTGSLRVSQAEKVSE